MNRVLLAGESILLTVWVGGLIAVGYLAAPVLFATLDDRMLAGDLAGRMFQVIHIVGLVCGVLLLAAAFYRPGRAWRKWVIAAMLALVAASAFVLQPMMAELKAAARATGAALGPEFGRLHGISSVSYLVLSLLGLSLAAAGDGRRSGDGSR